MADALALGASVFNVGVRVPSPAPVSTSHKQGIKILCTMYNKKR